MQRKTYTDIVFNRRTVETFLRDLLRRVDSEECPGVACWHLEVGLGDSSRTFTALESFLDAYEHMLSSGGSASIETPNSGSLHALLQTTNGRYPDTTVAIWGDDVDVSELFQTLDNATEAQKRTVEAVYRWSYTVQGTIRWNDLRHLDQVLGHLEPKSWMLSGPAEIGNATIQATNLEQLHADRLEVPTPASVSLEAGNQYRSVNTVWASLKLARAGDGKVWELEAGASGADSKHDYDRTVRGLKEFAGRFQQETCPQRLFREKPHWEKVGWALMGAIYLSVLIVGLPLLIAVLGRLAGNDFSWAQHWWLVAGAATIAVLVVAAVRVYQLVQWHPRVLDLTEVNNADLPQPPRFLARDLWLMVVGTAGSIAGSLAIAAMIP